MVHEDPLSPPTSKPNNSRPSPSWWRRLFRLFVWFGGISIGLLIALIIAVFVGANTQRGQDFIVKTINDLTHDQVELQGLSGTFPQHLRINHLILRDSEGIWLEIKQGRLDWSILSLLKKNLQIDQLSAKTITIFHMPKPSSQETSSSEFNPVRLKAEIKHVQIDELTTDSPVTPFPLKIFIKGQFATQDFFSFVNNSSIVNLPATNLVLSLHDSDLTTDLQIQANIADQQLKTQVQFHTKKQGDTLLGKIIHSNRLDPATINFIAQGPFQSVQTHLDISAAEAKIQAEGQVNLINSSMDLKIRGQSPEMTLNSQTGWGGWKINAAAAGRFKAPVGKGQFELNNLVVGDEAINHFIVDFVGEKKSVTDQSKDSEMVGNWAKVHLTAEGIRIPGKQPYLLADSPVVLEATYHPDMLDQPINIHLQHSLLNMTGNVFVGQSLHGQLAVVLPNLEPLADLGGISLSGSTALKVNFLTLKKEKQAIQVDVDGPLTITGGSPAIVQTIGKDGHVGLHALINLDQPQMTVRHFSLIGKGINVSAEGEKLADVAKGQLTVQLPNLTTLSPVLRGKAEAQLTINGRLEDLDAQMRVSTTVSALQNTGYKLRSSQLDLMADVKHLPFTPQASVILNGTLDQAPIHIQLQAGKRSQKPEYYFSLGNMHWRSLSAAGDMNLSKGLMIPTGNLRLNMAHLSDLQPIIRNAINGSFNLDLKTSQQVIPKVIINMDAALITPSVKVGRVSLAGSVENPLQNPMINLKLHVDRLQAAQVQGNGQITLQGKLNALNVISQVHMSQLLNAPGNLDAALTLDINHQIVQLKRLNALVKGESIRLLSSSKVKWGEQLAFDHLRLSVAPAGASVALIDVAGDIKPKLNLTASVKNITPAIAKPFMPDLEAQGIVNASARLKGSLDKPSGEMNFTLHDAKILTGSAASLPPAELTASATLNGDKALLRSEFQAGDKVHFAVQGNVPIQMNGPLALQIGGGADLSATNALLGAYGQHVQGKIVMNMRLNGTPIKPIIQGETRLSEGSFQDYAQGIRLHKIEASLLAKQDQIILDSFNAIAGDGQISMKGNVGVFQPGIPIDLHLIMRNARPLTSDLLTAVLDSDINVKGMAKSRLDVVGNIGIKRADINIPHSFSRSVVSIQVIRPGDESEKEKVNHNTGPIIGMDLNLKSTGNIIVQGFGLFTNMSGSLHVGGTAQDPQVKGGFDMQNGRIDLAGMALTLTKGQVSFKGSGVTRKIDPSLDFEAVREVEGNTAKLNITGYASAPKIQLSSTPPLPQDRVLSILLFGKDSQNLSPTQMAEIGMAVATLGGEGSGFDPLGTMRKALHLDRLSVGGGGDKNNNASKGASVEAGKYIAHGIYLGAKQSTNGEGTQAEVQIDLTKNLKATGTVGTGKDKTGFVTPDNDPGSSLGLLYQFNY